MQDRFKFRVWDKENKTYKSPDAPFYICENGTILDKHFDIRNDVTVEFSTGLKDKNGKLIYKGDIVRYAEVEFEEDTEREIAEVIWGGDYHYPAFDLKNKDFDGMNALSYLFGDGWTVEIIGNIYEDPELLEIGQ